MVMVSGIGRRTRPPPRHQQPKIGNVNREAKGLNEQIPYVVCNKIPYRIEVWEEQNRTRNQCRTNNNQGVNSTGRYRR